ncbi:MAG TPA: GAF domain-containing sensor histidine kinase [Spirochaetota bacterium]|nr:GAF domain-containing sensor histidine kinase [Spirochaetota bacterium]HPJ33524.1 GAF domain-containing sensor histidine kinase [Spirochaetota bacterium]
MTENTLIFFEEQDLLKPESFSETERFILEAINMKVAGGNSLADILDFLFSETKKIIPCDRMDVAFLEDDNTRMVLHSVKTVYNQVYLKKGFASDVITGSIRRVFQSGIPSVINDMRSHAKTHPMSESTKHLVREGIMSSMVCPLMVDDRPVGVFMCRSRTPDAYGKHEVSLQMAFAQRMGQAVEKAYIIEQLSTAMSSYMEMLSFVSHELKNPLTSIIMTAQTLSSGFFGEIGKKQKHATDRIIAKAEYLLNLTGEYLSLAGIENGEIKMRTKIVDFYRDVILHSIDIVNPLFISKNISFREETVKVLPNLKCDPELMKIVLTNFLSNAAKYSDKGAEVLLKISIKDDMLRVAVWNEGPGFPESEKMNLFKRFSILKTPELAERKGHGVGLYVTWKIIQLHGGHIWADSEHGKWAEFYFEIPLNENFPEL